MKHLALALITTIVALFGNLAMADATYPYTSPSYQPTATSPAVSYSAPADYLFQSNGLSVVSLKVTGTCTNLAATLQGSTDNGTNWTDLNLAAVLGGSTTSVSAAGHWRANAAAFNKLRFHITALTASCSVAMAGTQDGFGFADPCDNPYILKSSAVIAQGASTTTKVVDVATGKAIYVCGFVATAAGTNPTFTFKSGTNTSTDCDTGAATLSGAMVPTATTGAISVGGRHTILATAVTKQLCLTTAATTSIQGILNYVQQ